MTSTCQPTRRAWFAALLTLAAGLVAGATTASPAAAAAATLAPAQLTRTAGGTGGQPVSAMATKDQSGTQNTWNRYVEFSGAYSGWTRYQLPAGTRAADLTGLGLDVNFLGPDTGTQTWTWSVYDWSTGTWVRLGANPATGGWSGWRQASWAAPAPAARLASGAGEIRIRLRANNAADAMDVDHQVVTISTTGGGGAAGGGGGDRWVPAQADRWMYQLGDPAPKTGVCQTPHTGGACVRPNVWVFDLYDASGSTVNTAGVNAVRAVGGKAVCYVSGGTWEDWRPDAAAFPAAVLAGNVQGGPNGQPWPGERWFDIRQTATLEPLLAARAQKCKTAGFDAMEWDNVDAYANETGLALTGSQQLTYNKMLARVAHEAGLSVGLKNDLDQVPQLVGDFDFAINEQCYQYGNECGALQPFLAAGKAVVQIEYSDASDGPDAPAPTLAQLCPPANTAGRSAIYMTINLPATPWAPCR